MFNTISEEINTNTKKRPAIRGPSLNIIDITHVMLSSTHPARKSVHIDLGML